VAQWFRWLRSEVGQVEYLGLIEWTTGNGAQSGGHRRMHQHTLVKGLPDDADLDALWRAGKRRWERLTGAWRVELRELRSAGGATAYIVGHHHKGEQAPPRGWKGRRFRASKGYFAPRTSPQLREEVKARMRSVAARRAVEAALDNVCPDGAAGLDEGEWERLIEQLQPVQKPRVVRVMRQGRQLVDASTGELVDG